MKVRFFIPGQPVPKARPRVTRNGTFTDRKTKGYEHFAGVVAMNAMRGLRMMHGPVEMQVQFRFPIPKSWPKWKREAAANGEIKHIKRPDYDNLAKAVSDALNDVAYDDDAQVWRCVVEKVYAVNPGAEVVLIGGEWDGFV